MSTPNRYNGPIFWINEKLNKTSSRAFDYDLSLLKKEYDRILYITKREIDSNPKDIESYFFRSLVQFHLGNYHDALDSANKFEELAHKSFGDLFYLQGKSYEDDNDLDWSHVCYSIADILKISSNRILRIAYLCMIKNEWDKAEVFFQKALVGDKSDFHVYKLKATALWEQGKKNEAIENLVKCKEIIPSSGQVFSLLSRYRFALNSNFEEAICLARKAIDLDKSNSDTIYFLAGLYASWNSYNALLNSFVDAFDISEQYLEYCNVEAFDSRINIARGLYGKSFLESFTKFEKYFDEFPEYIRLAIFVGSPNFLLDMLKTKTVFFANVTTFPDKVSDSPLLNPLNHSHMGINISYDNIRVRCCSLTHENDDIIKCLSMWDRYANGHSGLCYILNIPKNWLVRNKVYVGQIQYVNEVPAMIAENPEQVIRDGLFIKNIGYKDENEIRLVAFGNFNSINGDKFNFFGGYNEKEIKIEKIFLGARMDETIKKDVMALTSGFSNMVDVYQLSEIGNGKLECIRRWL